MTEEDIEQEFKEQFPDLDISASQAEFTVFKQVILDFILPFQNEDLVVYMNSRAESKCISQHLADLPQGIYYFEEWFNKGLLDFASKILNTLQSTIPKDQIYLSFAQLLDNKDLKIFFDKSQFSKTEEKQLTGALSSFIANPELDLFLQALSCMYLGLNNSAKSLLKLWIQALWFDGDDIQQIIDKAKSIEAVSSKASKSGIKGSSTRWASKNKAQDYAIDLMLEGNYKNASRAASSIKKQVMAYGESVGFRFSDEDRAYTTIAKWLRDHIRKTNTN